MTWCEMIFIREEGKENMSVLTRKGKSGGGVRGKNLWGKGKPLSAPKSVLTTTIKIF